jgi:hypothetical protein
VILVYTFANTVSPLGVGISNQSIASFFPSIQSGSSADLFLLLIAVFLTVRMYRNWKGLKFTRGRVYYAPVIYTILLVLDVVSFYFIGEFTTFVAFALLAIVVGVLAGLRYGGGVKFYEKDNTTYYKRSPYILVAWIVVYIVRIALSFLYPTVLLVNLIVEAALAFTTGLIIGEAVHINRKYDVYKKEHPQKSPA